MQRTKSGVVRLEIQMLQMAPNKSKQQKFQSLFFKFFPIFVCDKQKRNKNQNLPY